MTGAIAQAGDNRLAVLAADIRQAHRDVKASALAVATRAVDAGQALIEAKTLVKHGQWKEWLRGNVAMSERTAQRYMQVARSGLKNATVAVLGIRGAAEAIARHKAPEPEDFRVHLNDSAGWPMPPPGGKVLIEECNGGMAVIWPISEQDGIQYYDMLAIPSGPNRPVTYLKRGGAATVVAHALARDGFTLANCNCAVFDTPFEDGGMLRQWREEDREFEYAKVRENWTEAQRAAHAVRRAARRAGVAISALSATDGSSADDWLRVASIPTEKLDAAIRQISETGGELTAEAILARAEALA